MTASSACNRKCCQEACRFWARHEVSGIGGAKIHYKVSGIGFIMKCLA